MTNKKEVLRYLHVISEAIPRDKPQARLALNMIEHEVPALWDEIYNLRKEIENGKLRKGL